MSDFAVELTDVKKTYQGDVKAVRGVNLRVRIGEMLAIMGKSGSGKSTLMNLIGSLDRPDSGTIKVFDHDIAKIRSLAAFRRREVGFVFQLHCLLPHMTLLDNVAVAMIGERDAKAKSLAALKQVGLNHRSDHVPGKVSGGERQRAAIARAIVNQPRLLLADEPTGNVDSESEAAIMDLFQQMRDEHDMTIIMVTHDDSVAQRADRIAYYVDGLVDRVEEVKSPA